VPGQAAVAEGNGSIVGVLIDVIQDMGATGDPSIQVVVLRATGIIIRARALSWRGQEQQQDCRAAKDRSAHPGSPKPRSANLVSWTGNHTSVPC
jgi:hypothetical protein